MESIGKALAGHAGRCEVNESLSRKTREYDNPLTDMVNLFIAENAAKASIRDLAKKKTKERQ